MPTELATRHSRADLIAWYLSKGKAPCDLPDWFFRASEEPTFVPPSGHPLTEFVEETVDESGNPATVLRQSAYWIGAEEVQASTIVYPASAEVALAAFASLNELYQLAKTEWHEEYLLRTGRQKP